MSIQIECPGCKATLTVPDELAGKQGKCVQCGHKLTVPNKSNGGSVAAVPPPPSPQATTSPAPPSPGGAAARPAAPVASSPSLVSKVKSSSLSPTLFEATPEAMVRELHLRQQSALLLLFPTPADGSYDLANVPDGELKCIATEDVNQARFAQLVASFSKKFAPRPRVGTASVQLQDQLYELKGDRLGMSLDEFKEKYARASEGNVKLPLCSDTAWGANKASLHSEPWHKQAGIVHARVDLPSEDNSPTVAGVKTELLLYQFLEGKLFRIAAQLPTDQFHVISEAAVKKYGPTTRQTTQPRQLIWENPVASIVLTRGQVHPREPSMLELVYKQLAETAASRAPTAAADI